MCQPNADSHRLYRGRQLCSISLRTSSIQLTTTCESLGQIQYVAKTSAMSGPESPCAKHTCKRIFALASVISVLARRPREVSPGLAITAGSRKPREDRKSTRLNSSHVAISYAVFCLKKKKNPFI